MEKRTWKIITICFIVAGLLFVTAGVANPFKQDITSRIYAQMTPGGEQDISDLTADTELTFLTTLDPDDLDQEQTLFDCWGAIGKPPALCSAQGAINDRDDLLGVKVYIKTFDTATSYLFVGIMTSLGDPSKTASYEKLAALPPGSAPNTWTWMQMDFSDDPLEIDAGVKFWIVLYSSELISGGYRGWGGSLEAPYPPATTMSYDYNQKIWKTLYEQIDMCFKTYTDSGGSPPEVYLGEAVTCEWINGWQDHGPKVTDWELGEKVLCYLEWQPTTHDFYGDTIGHKWYFNGAIVYENEFLITEHWYGVWWQTWHTNLPEGQGYVAAYWNGQYLGASNDFTVGDPAPHKPIIDISISSTVLTLGAFSWIGAAISFTKYRFFL